MRRRRIWLVAFALFAATACDIRTMHNEGQAMSPTIKDGDSIQVTGQLGTIQRYDIIVFRYPKDQSKVFVKRVIGLPGERISSNDGHVLINGRAIDEPYVIAENRSHDTFPEEVVPANAYFVMGDHRNNSSDSRSWGTVSADLIQAKMLQR